VTVPPTPQTLNQRIADQLLGAVAWLRDISMFVKAVLVAECTERGV
jgi:hypothetical protein